MVWSVRFFDNGLNFSIHYFPALVTICSLTRSVGICGTDLHEYLVGPLATNKKEKPHSITGAHVPITLGHEFCGRIVKTAPDSDLKVGQVSLQSNSIEELC